MRSSDPHSGRRPRRGRLLLLAAIVVPAVIGAAALVMARRGVETTTPATTSVAAPVELSNPAPTQAELEGIWSLDDGDYVMRFADDGTYAFDDGGLLEDPGDSGTYSVFGSTLTLVARDSRYCETGQRWEWQVELLGDDRVHGVVTSDECFGRPVDWTWTRVSPDSRFER